MSFISAGNTTTTTLLINGDTTGNLVFNTGGANTTALTISNTQNATFANAATISGALAVTGQTNHNNTTYVTGGRTFLRPNSEVYALGVQYNSSGGQAYIGATNSANPDMIFSNNSGTEIGRFTNAGVLSVGGLSPASYGTNSVIQSSSNSYACLSLRHSGATAGQYWYIGPNAANNYVVFNQDATGVYVVNGGTSWGGQSDERIKTDLKPILDGLSKVTSLRAVTGRFKRDAEGTSRAFLIAQDVQKVLPEAVNEVDGILGLQYTDTIPLLVAAIKELNAKVEAQAAEIAALKAGA